MHTYGIKMQLYYYVVSLRNIAQRPSSGSTIGTFQQQCQQKESPNAKLQFSEQRVVCYAT